jgi:hypothetical protein
VTGFKNELGGNVFVFSGTPVAPFRIDTAFSFLTYSRKQQLIELLEKSGELVAYYPNDEEIYLKCADMNDGRVFVAVFNIGFDPIERLEICCGFEAKKFAYLTPSGEEAELDFEYIDGKYVLDIACNTLNPVILFINK